MNTCLASANFPSENLNHHGSPPEQVWADEDEDGWKSSFLFHLCTLRTHSGPSLAESKTFIVISSGWVLPDALKLMKRNK
eukprot:CAMPEP_0184743410 /NCGR_PEP_ID=MMETSP0315-20130426/6290_1 /TAXON_ID=101924 /ORGANISM="Rhodosorus marinus, Strain UTEX LB 2760" /LENGTH=79 /DNA_ID=CAMNT_0027214669 /DNA_START=281 /DNA_END=520 /DNA_ORIENTATION=-